MCGTQYRACYRSSTSRSSSEIASRNNLHACFCLFSDIEDSDFLARVNQTRDTFPLQRMCRRSGCRARLAGTSFTGTILNQNLSFFRLSEGHFSEVSESPNEIGPRPCRMNMILQNCMSVYVDSTNATFSLDYRVEIIRNKKSLKFREFS